MTGTVWLWLARKSMPSPSRLAVIWRCFSPAAMTAATSFADRTTLRTDGFCANGAFKPMPLIAIGVLPASSSSKS